MSMQEKTLPPYPTHVASPTSLGSSIEKPRNMKSIQEFYDEIEEITNYYDNLFCLLVDSEPLDFNEAVKDERWRQGMEEEIKAIEKNNT